MKTLAGKRVLVVGATSAIAEAAARPWAQGGARLALAARDPQKLHALGERLTAAGAAQCAPIPCGLALEGVPQAGVASACAALGGLDAVLICFGVLGDAQARDGWEPCAEVLWVNFNSHAAWCLAAVPALKASCGHLLVVTSVAGMRGRASLFPYCAAQAGLSVFLEGLRQHVHPYRVRVTDLRPGRVRTPMTAHLPGGRLTAEPDAVGRGIARALFTSRRVVYLPFWWRLVMLAIRALPEPLLRRLNL